MPDITNSTIEKQVYNAQTDGSDGRTEITRVSLVVSPTSILVGGYNAKGEPIAARYSQSHNNNNWSLDFFEPQFVNEHLLSDNSKPITVFVASDKSMLVPKALYKEDTADSWFRQMHFIEKDEHLETQYLKEDKAYYLYSWPGMVKSLITRQFPKAKILPLACHQFNKTYKSGNTFECTITQKLAYLTLYKGKALQWHQVIAYNNAEEIAYSLKHAAQENGIEQYRLECATDNASLASVARELTQYFPDLVYGNPKAEDYDWNGAIYLLQQLDSCAS